MIDREELFTWEYPLIVGAMWAVIFVLLEAVLLEGNLLRGGIIGFLGGVAFGVMWNLLRPRLEDPPR